MINDEKKPALLLMIITVIVIITVMMYSVFDSPKYNPIKTELITTQRFYKITTVVYDELININTADIEELMKLKHIGEKKAEAIIEYRELNGAFRSVDELKEVSGISQNIIDANKGRITV